MQTCCTCGVEKALSEFHKDNSRVNGISPRCKSCKRVSDSKYRIAHKDDIRKSNTVYYAKNSEAIKQNSKSWYENNKDRCRVVKAEWYQRNKDAVAEYKKVYNKENAERVKQYMNAYMKKRYATDINYRLKSICNKRIRDYLRDKYLPTMDIVGCSIEFLKSWIEFQFNDTMNWNNMGTVWHIDHVKPCSSFNFNNDDEVFECYHWSNIRPLLAKDNIIKKDKYDGELIKKHQGIIEEFLKSVDVPSVL